MYKKIALYASQQAGENIPDYVSFALQHLSESDFHIVFLTTQTRLSPKAQAFLEENEIETFHTNGNGSYFGMWRRYLKTKVDSSLQTVERLLLINDEVVYYENKFAEYFSMAEDSPSDAVSLLMNTDGKKHQHCFFLYLKQEALGAFFLHILETPEQDSHKNIIRYQEIPLYSAFEEAEVTMDSLFHPTASTTFFIYAELVQKKAGFVDVKTAQQFNHFFDKLIGNLSNRLSWKVIQTFTKIIDQFKRRNRPSPEP